MNKIVFIALSTLALLTAGCGDGNARTKGNDSSSVYVLVLSRGGGVVQIPCAGYGDACRGNLSSEDRPVRVPGYESSATDLENRILTISYYSSSVRKMNFEEAIALSGFSVNNRPANPENEKRIPAGVK